MRPARRGRDAAVVHRALRQSAQHRARDGHRGRSRRRGRSRPCCRADRRRCQGAGVHLWRYREQQHRNKRSGPFRAARRQRAKARRHGGDRAQMRPRISGGSGRRGVRAGFPAGAPGWTAGPGGAACGAGSADAVGERHVGEQRDRRGAGHRHARGDRQAGGGAVPYRYCPGRGEDPARPDRLEGRSGLDQWPQALRTERSRRALCPATAARTTDPAVLGRRPGAWLAFRHPACPAGRGSRRGLPPGAGRNVGGGQTAGRIARPPDRPAPRGDPWRRGERQHGGADTWQPECHLSRCHRRGPDGARSGPVRFHRLGVFIRRDRAVLRAARPWPATTKRRRGPCASGSGALPRPPISTMRQRRWLRRMRGHRPLASNGSPRPERNPLARCRR